EEKIADGSLSLTNVSQASQFFQNNRIDDAKEKEKVLGQIENKSKKECEKILFNLQEEGEETPALPKKEKTRRNSSSTQELKFTVKDSTVDKLQELKNLLAHEGEKSMDELLNIMLETTILQIKKKKYKLVTSTS